MLTAPAPRFRLSAILAGLTTLAGVVTTVAADPRTADLAHADWHTAAGLTGAIVTGAGIAWQAWNKSVDRTRDPSTSSSAPVAADPAPQAAAAAAAAPVARPVTLPADLNAALQAGDARPGDAAGILMKVLVPVVAQRIGPHAESILEAALGAALGLGFPAAAPAVAAVKVAEAAVAAIDGAGAARANMQAGVGMAASDAPPGLTTFDFSHPLPPDTLAASLNVPNTTAAAAAAATAKLPPSAQGV